MSKLNLSEAAVLLVDDEADLRVLVKTILLRDGFKRVEGAASCAEALEKTLTGSYDLILLDVMLPDGDGFSLYQRMRNEIAETMPPVIFLSARDEDISRLKGLGLGADDYVTKPFLPQELLLRIKAVLRRTYRLAEENEELILGETRISFASGEVHRAGETQMLTAKEYAILKKLSENRGRIVTIDSLCATLWPDGSYGLENSLIVHIRHLREKIETDPSKPEYLLTVRGLGYKLAD